MEIRFSVFYSGIALILFVLGLFYQEWYYFAGAIILALCSFYWIWREKKISQK